MTKQMKIKIYMILDILALTFQQGCRKNHVVVFGLLLMAMLLFHRYTLLKYYGNGFLCIIIYMQVELDILKQNLIQSLFFSLCVFYFLHLYVIAHSLKMKVHYVILPASINFTAVLPVLSANMQLLLRVSSQMDYCWYIELPAKRAPF